MTLLPVSWLIYVEIFHLQKISFIARCHGDKLGKINFPEIDHNAGDN